MQDCIENMHGSLTYLPDKYKHWRTMDEYREKWSFLPWSLRHRVAEQLMSFDYLWSLQDWLDPKYTIAYKQKVLSVTVIASVYEGILSVIINDLIKTRGQQDKFFEKVRHRPRGDWRFVQLINLGESAGIYGPKWGRYLNNLREVRNWIHLSDDRKTELVAWLDQTSYQTLMNNLYKFHNIVAPYFT